VLDYALHWLIIVSVWRTVFGIYEPRAMLGAWLLGCSVRLRHRFTRSSVITYRSSAVGKIKGSARGSGTFFLFARSRIRSRAHP